MPAHAKPFEPEVDIALPAATPGWGEPLGFLQDLALRYTPAFYLDVGNTCNLACVYCGLDRSQQTYATLDDLERTLRMAIAHGLRKVALIGGEPTIRKGLERLVQRARDLGCSDVLVTTNGLVLSYPDVLARLVDAGLTTVHLSLDDFDPATLAALTRRRDAGELLERALANLLGRPELHVFLYAVLTRANLPHLDAYLQRLEALREQYGRAPTVVWTAVKPQGRALADLEAVVPPLHDTAAAVRRALDDARRLDLPAACRGLPPCLLDRHANRALESYMTEARMDLQTGEIRPVPRDHHLVHPAECAGCPHLATCPGVHGAYLTLPGWRALPATAAASARSPKDAP